MIECFSRRIYTLLKNALTEVLLKKLAILLFAIFTYFACMSMYTKKYSRKKVDLATSWSFDKNTFIWLFWHIVSVFLYALAIFSNQIPWYIFFNTLLSTGRATRGLFAMELLICASRPLYISAEASSVQSPTRDCTDEASLSALKMLARHDLSRKPVLTVYNKSCNSFYRSRWLFRGWV